MTQKEVALEYKKFLADTDIQHAFNFKNNGSIRNIVDMLSTVSSCTLEDFEFHVNDSKNDIAQWIHDVLEDHTLAEQLRNVTGKKATAALIKHRIHEATAYVSHVQSNTKHHTPKIAQIAESLQHLETDMEHTLGHTSKSAPFKYQAEKNPRIVSHSHIKDFCYGLVVGLIFGLVLARISGVI